MKNIDVLLADSQPLTNIGLKALFQKHENISIIDEVTTVTHLKNKLLDLKPTLLVMDYQCIDGFTNDDINLVRGLSGCTQVLIITEDSDKLTILKFLKAGVKGFLTKKCSHKEVLEAIDSVVLGKRFFCSTVLDMLMEQHTNNQNEATYEKGLSSREKQILKLIAEGKMTKQIAETLNLSPHTINSHRKNIIKKLGIKSPSEFVIKAINMNLITTEERN